VVNFATGLYPYFTEFESLTAKGVVLAPSLLQLTVRGAIYSWVSEDLPGRKADSSPVTIADVKHEWWLPVSTFFHLSSWSAQE
jgi:hypothetical protein